MKMKVDGAKFPTEYLMLWRDHVLKSDRQPSNCKGMMGRLVRLMVAMLIATAFIAAPAVQAAIAMPCDTVVTNATDHVLSSVQTPAPTPAPCKGTMPGCAAMLGCGLGASLPSDATATSHKLTWTSAIYPAVADSHAGLSVEPDLGPPITI